MQHRPKYHFLPEKNWMNDPNGPIFHNGIHHLFYQYNPTDWHWGNLHWGHATSKDLLHWEHQPIALYPAIDRGETNCYSGSSYLHDGKIELIYTSVGNGERRQIDGSEQWIAVTEDNITWKQVPENPVLTLNDHGDKSLTQWRDPFLFEYKGQLYLLVAGISDGKRGAVHIYTGNDYRHWSYLGEFFSNSTPTKIIECPNLVVFGDKLLFLYSVWNQREIRYHIGTMDEKHRFISESKGRIDYGEFFASQISFDNQGNVYLWGWLREFPRNLLYTDGEWAGVQAIPRIISLNEKQELVIRRLPQLEKLRRESESVSLDNFTGRHVFEMKSNTVEIVAKVKTEDVFSIRVLASENLEEYTDIMINPEEGTMQVPLRNSSLLEEVDHNLLKGKFRKSEDGTIEVDILLDCSVIEIFVNDDGCMSPRVYPVLDGKEISFASGGKIQEAEITLYYLEL